MKRLLKIPVLAAIPLTLWLAWHSGKALNGQPVLLQTDEGTETSDVTDGQITVAFYNLENLFDYKDDPKIDDAEFLPGGYKAWTKERYEIKQRNMAKVIAGIGDADGPEILGVVEVENKAVLEDLIRQPELKNRNYGIVHYDSPDGRGIDVALLYKKDVFRVKESKALDVTFPDDPEYDTRDVLMVRGVLNNEETFIVVNHWPSRRGGAEESAPRRLRAAAVARYAVDSVLAIWPDAHVIAMGDFNDDPVDESVRSVLRANGNLASEDLKGFYNPFYTMYDHGVPGTLMYNFQWNIFDQVMVTRSLMGRDEGLRYKNTSAAVYRPQWMQQEGSAYARAPQRSYIGKNFIENGYSDHFPVYIHLLTK